MRRYHVFYPTITVFLGPFGPHWLLIDETQTEHRPCFRVCLQFCLHSAYRCSIYMVIFSWIQCSVLVPVMFFSICSFYFLATRRLYVLAGPNSADVAHWCGMRMLLGWLGFSPGLTLAAPPPAPTPSPTPRLAQTLVPGPDTGLAHLPPLPSCACPKPPSDVSPLSGSSCYWWPTSTRWLAASESEVVVSGGK